MTNHSISFKNYVCWNDKMVTRVMDTEALQVPDHIFLATHHPVKMYRENLTDAAYKIEYDEDEFLDNFLSPKDFILVAIRGGAGTGKSHLVRWLKANIPETKNRRVLLIPKVGTNLKGIVKLILEGMPGKRFDEYRARLEQSTSYQSESQVRERLLNNLAVAVGPNGPHNMDNLSDYQKHLAEELPNLLYDPHFRSYLLKDEGIIHRLTVHMLGDLNRVERPENRCEFNVSDLPLSIADFDKAGHKALGCYENLISLPELRQEAVDWMNKNLNEAVAGVLNLNNENLFNLMLDVRESLAERGIELVILIEDFAKLQGIDNQLLESLLVRPDQPGRKRLCSLRTAFAVTSGYFDKLVDTVRQRIEFRVNLDVEVAGKKGFVTLNDVEQLAARYLNAARQNDDSLASWHRQTLATGDSMGDPVPAACPDSGCPYLETCHNAFGHWQEMGLYPFTRTALNNMFKRACGEEFNPRAIINKILRHTLENYSGHQASGEFPPPALAQHFGGVKMSAALKTLLQENDPANHLRRQVLLEFWSDGKSAADLDPAIHDAFCLPPLGLEDDVGALEDDEEEEVKEVTIESFPANLEKKFKLIDSWSNGGELPQALAGDLREAIFYAVSNRIDWDSELLLANQFKGNGKPFKQTSVNFIRQATRPMVTETKLMIPLDDNFSDAAMALQGLLAYNHFGNWKFRDGSRHLRAYARLVEKWAQHILEQVRQPVPGKEWSPVPAAVEMLAIGARMAGHPTADEPSGDMLLAALFEDLDNVDSAGRTPAWKNLFRLFVKQRKDLTEIVLSRASCTKGAAANVQIIDANQIIKPIRDLIAGGWWPSAEIPDDWRKDHVVSVMRNKSLALLSETVKEEQAQYLTWHSKVRSNIGDPSSQQELIEALRLAVQRARDEGALTGATAQEIEDAIAVLDIEGLETCCGAIANVAGVTNFGQLLGGLGRVDAKVMQAADTFIDTAGRFLEHTTRRVETDINDLQGSGGKDLEHILESIKKGLDELQNLIKQA